MIRIALICAYPIGTNTGMLSVDLAFESIVLNNASVTRFCFWRGKQKQDKLDLDYIELKEVRQLEHFDKIIFWGDFLHWIKYFNIDWKSKTLDRNPTMTESDAEDLWYKIFLLEDRVDLQKRSIVFGSTLYGLDSNQLSNRRYTNALKSLYSNCRLALHRDIFSTSFIKQLTNTNNINFGCDCALLLDSRLYVNAISQTSSDYFLYSFVRSNKNEILTKLVLDLGKRINKTPIELKWLTKGTSVNHFIDCITKIKQSSFVITDIYHFAVNANRENIKTICVGNSADDVTNTLSDKKKEIFYSQHFQRHNYICTENIVTDYDNTINKIINQLADDKSFKFAFDHLNSYVATVKEQLTKEILA